MKMLRRIEAPAPLDRFIGVCKRYPFNQQQRAPLGNLQQPGSQSIGRNRAQALVGTTHANTELGLEQTVQRHPAGLQDIQREIRKQVSRKINLIENGRLVTKAQQPANDDDRRPGLKRER